MDVDEVRKLLKDECERCGGQAVWATRSGLSPAYVSDTLNYRRDPGPAIVLALGLKKIVTYVRMS